MLAASLLAGGVALAQQGMIVQPWGKPAAPARTPVSPSRPMPASGLPPANAALPAPRKAEPTGAAAALPPPQVGKWTPPVVTLLVDPWAKTDPLAGAPRPRWVPPSSEIIDPWADDSPPEPPRVAESRPADLPRDTIF